MDDEKITIQTKPAKKSTIPVLYFVTISLQSGNQAVLYSRGKKLTEAFVTDVKSGAKLS